MFMKKLKKTWGRCLFLFFINKRHHRSLCIIAKPTLFEKLALVSNLFLHYLTLNWRVGECTWHSQWFRRQHRSLLHIGHCFFAEFVIFVDFRHKTVFFSLNLLFFWLPQVSNLFGPHFLVEHDHCRRLHFAHHLRKSVRTCRLGRLAQGGKGRREVGGIRGQDQIAKAKMGGANADCRPVYQCRNWLV